MTTKEFALRIKFLRDKHGLSQREVARCAGLHYNTLYNIETGNASISLDTLNRLAVVFDLKPFELIR